MSDSEDDSLPHGFEPDDSFDKFFELNQDRINEMMRADQYELLYAVWFGGYDYGLRTMANFHRPLWGLQDATDS